MGHGILGAIGTGGFFAAAFVSTVFIFLYPALARFYKTESGLHIFSLMFVITVLLDHGVISLIFGNYFARDLVRAIAFPILAVVLAWRVLILIRVQLLDKLRKRQESE